MGYGDGVWTKNRTGSWSLSVSIDGKRYKRTAPTKTDARQKVSELREELSRGSELRNDLTVQQVLDDFIDRDLASRRRAPATVERHRWARDKVAGKIGTVKVADLKVREVESMLDELATDLSPASLTKVRNHLSQALRFAARDDQSLRDVAQLAKIPPGSSRTRKRRSLTKAEADALEVQLTGADVTGSKHRNGLAFVLMLRIGLRPGEAFGLCWDALDLETGTLNVTRGVRRDGGKVELVDDLKVESARRTIQMPPEIVSLLDSHRLAQDVERTGVRRWQDDRLVFASPRGTVVDPARARHTLKEACSAAEIAEIAPNELRHTCASLLSDRGIPNESIADLLGHTSTRMVDATYRHRLRPVIDVVARTSARFTTP